MHQMMSVSYAAPNRFVSVAANRQTETTVTTGTKETTTKATTSMTTLKTNTFNQILTSTSHPLTTITTVKTTNIPRRETVDSPTTVMTTSTIEPTTETRRVIKVRFPQRTSIEQQKTENFATATTIISLIPVRNNIEGTTTTPSMAIKTSTTTSTSTTTTNTVSENMGIDELNGVVAAVKARRHLVSNTNEIIGKLSRVAEVVEQQAKPITEFPLPSNDTNLGQWHELLNGFRSTTPKTMVNSLPKATTFSTAPLPSRSVGRHRSRRQQPSNDRNQHPPPPPSIFLEPEDHPNTQQRLIGVQQRARRWLPSNEPQRSVIVGITSFGSPVIVSRIHNFKH